MMLLPREDRISPSLGCRRHHLAHPPVALFRAMYTPVVFLGCVPPAPPAPAYRRGGAHHLLTAHEQSSSASAECDEGPQHGESPLAPAASHPSRASAPQTQSTQGGGAGSLDRKSVV